MPALPHALRPVFRSLLRNPGFAVAAILTLGLGLGANIAILSASYGVLVRELPYREAERLTLIRAEADYTGSNRPTRISLQPGDVETWTESTGVLRSSAFYAPAVSALSGPGGSELLNTAIVSPGFFDEMGGPLSAGRPLNRQDDASPVAVISERLAERLFGSPEAATGQTIRLRPDAYVVVGVARSTFDFPGPDVDAWLPAGFSRTTNPSCCSFEVIARLPPGATLEAAGAEAKTLFQALPSSARSASPTRVRAIRLVDDRVAAVRPALLVLSAAAFLLMLIACINVVNLLLARNAAREPEFAIRRALGARAGRLAGQLASEGLVLALAGGALGLAGASLILHLMTRLAAGSVPRLEGIHVDGASVLIGLILVVLTTVGTTLFPVFRVIQGPDIPPRSGDRAGRSFNARILLRGMCAVQVAMAMTLLIGAAVMNRSLLELLDVDLGVSRERVVTASLNLAFGESLDDAQTRLRVDRVLQGVAAAPGIRALGVGAAVPPHLARMQVTLRRKDQGVDYRAAAVPATPGYFSALQLRLREGRFFDERDSENGAPVMIMTAETAARFFSDHPLGRTLAVPRLRDGKMSTVDMTLVGIVENVKYAGLASPSDDVIYVPFQQQSWRSAFLVVRTDRSPEAIAVNLRKAISDADPGVVVGEVATLDQLVSGQAAGPRFRTLLLSLIAFLATAIAAAGLYGMVAYSVSQRTREVGIRVAIGATARDVVGMILRETLATGAVGVAVGLALALQAVKLLEGLVYGVAPADPLSIIVASAALLVVIALAGYIPARRASRAAPVDALRTE